MLRVLQSQFPAESEEIGVSTRLVALGMVHMEAKPALPTPGEFTKFTNSTHAMHQSDEAP